MSEDLAAKAQRGRDPLRGMPPEWRAEFDGAGPALQRFYLDWWEHRPDRRICHRDAWPAIRACWSHLRGPASVQRAA